MKKFFRFLPLLAALALPAFAIVAPAPSETRSKADDVFTDSVRYLIPFEEEILSDEFDIDSVAADEILCDTLVMVEDEYKYGLREEGSDPPIFNRTFYGGTLNLTPRAKMKANLAARGLEYSELGEYIYISDQPLGILPSWETLILHFDENDILDGVMGIESSFPRMAYELSVKYFPDWIWYYETIDTSADENTLHFNDGETNVYLILDNETCSMFFF